VTDRETIDVYNARAGDYAKLETSKTPSTTLAAFIAALPKGAHVLDLGCGPGTSAVHMVRAGFSVEAVDASEAMIALAAQIPNVTARQATFDEITGRNVYDGVWANFSLLHAPRADFPRHLAAIHQALKPGGPFHIALKEGTGEHRDSLGRQYAYYTEDELKGLLETAGFSVGRYRRGRDKGLSGTDENWMSVTAHA
jgi:trans-aconitate methyltransferase